MTRNQPRTSGRLARELNRARAGIATGALSLWAAGAALGIGAGCSSPKPSEVADTHEQGPQADNYLKDARTELQAGNLSAARVMVELADEEGAPEAKSQAILADLERAALAEASAAGDIVAAYGYQKRAAELEPDPAKAFDDLLHAVELGQQIGIMPAELANLASRAVDLNVSSAQAQDLAARLWDDAGDPARALPHYQWLHKTAPEDTRIALRLATIQESLGELDAARRILNEVWREHPDQVIAGMKLADVFAKIGQARRAEETWEALLSAHPENPTILQRYAQFLRSRGQTQRAADLEVRARATQPPSEKPKMRKLR